MNGDGWRYLAQGRSEIVELGDDTVPAVEEAHFFVALTRVLVRMHHPGDVTAARALVAHRDHGGEAQPRRSGTPTCRQHGRKHQTRLRHHFQKTTRIIAGAAVRTLHESMESPARLQIEGAHFGGPWFRTPHSLSKSGSDQARQSAERGARRPRAIIRSWNSAFCAAFSVMSVLLLMKAFDEVDHAIGSALPHGALFGYPLLGLQQPRRHQLAGTRASLLAGADQATALQHRQVLQE